MVQSRRPLFGDMHVAVRSRACTPSKTGQILHKVHLNGQAFELGIAGEDAFTVTIASYSV